MERASSSTTERLPLPGAIGLLLVLWATGLSTLRAACGGELCFPLDDAWIHLAIARNLVEHGTWGLVPGVPGGSTTSPLWTALIVPWQAAGRGPEGALGMGLLSGALLLAAADRALRVEGLAAAPRLFTLIALVLLVPVPAMALLGMEHLLHAALALGLLSLAVQGRSALPLAALLPLARPEGLFAVAVAGVLLRHRPAAALGTLAAGLVPLGLYGAWSVAQGWFWLPAPALLKSGLAQPDAAPWDRALDNLRAAPALALAALALLALGRRSPRWSLAATACLGLQLGLARVGWLSRYEAWTVALTVVAAGAAWPGLGRLPRLLALALALLLAPRAWRASAEQPDRAAMTWRMHVQLGRFLSTLPPGTAVGGTEAGAPVYLSSVRLVDLAGLGHAEVARQRLAGTFDADAVGRVLDAEGADLVTVFGWFDGPPHGPGMPPGWTLVARWPDPGIPADSQLGFWARQGQEEGVRERLRAWQGTLPGSVRPIAPP
ncbi:hypothetical protein L6R53_14935 [Myxococcota bacterium]|nr:hypothetical protein [Myxococcota bacterium]